MDFARRGVDSEHYVLNGMARQRPALGLPREAICGARLGLRGCLMRYIVTDDFVAAHGWTPDITAKALMEPLGRIGVHVVRTRGFGQGGLQSDGLRPDEFRAKHAEVGRIVSRLLTGPPPVLL